MKNHSQRRVAATAFLLIQTVAGQALAASSCNWPIEVIKTLPDNGYPATIEFVFAAPNPNTSTIEVFETTRINIGKFQREYESKIRGSPEWKSLQDKINCHNRVRDINFSLTQASKDIKLRMTATIEKHWCSAVTVLCSTPDKPARTCRKEQSGKVWGASIASDTVIGMDQDPVNGIRPIIRSVNTSSVTSKEQDLVRSLFGIASGGVFGAVALAQMEEGALSALRTAMAEGLRSADFEIPGKAESIEIPTYSPELIDVGFETTQDLELAPMSLEEMLNRPTRWQVVGSHFEVFVKRRVVSYPEGAGCFIAKTMRKASRSDFDDSFDMKWMRY